MLRITGVIGLAIIVLAIVLAVWTRPTYHIGRANDTNPDNIVGLVSSTTPVDADNFDSWQSPRGTDYQVPSDKTTYITDITGFPQVTSGNIVMEIGYGDEAVSNSASAPTGATVVWSATWAAEAGSLQALDVWAEIPAEKYPFVHLDQQGAIQATGVER